MLVDTSLYKCLLFYKTVVLEIVVDSFKPQITKCALHINIQ